MNVRLSDAKFASLGIIGMPSCCPKSMSPRNVSTITSTTFGLGVDALIVPANATGFSSVTATRHSIHMVKMTRQTETLHEVRWHGRRYGCSCFNMTETYHRVGFPDKLPICTVHACTQSPVPCALGDHGKSAASSSIGGLLWWTHLPHGFRVLSVLWLFRASGQPAGTGARILSANEMIQGGESGCRR